MSQSDVNWWVEPLPPPPQTTKPSEVTPDSQPKPCSECGGGVFWRDIYNQLHCAECVEIPARQLCQSFWYIYSNPLRWGPLDEDHWSKHWNPFAHLIAARKAQAQQEAAKETF